MKTFSILATVALIGLAPVTVQATPAQAAASGQVQGVDAEALLDTAIVKFNAVAAMPASATHDAELKVAYDGVVGSLRQAFKELDAIPTTAEVRKRLMDAIQNVYDRGHNAAIDKLELAELRSDALNHRVRNAVRTAITNAKAGTSTVAHARHILNVMIIAADAAKEANADLSEIRANVQARIEALIKKAKIDVKDYEALDLELTASIAAAHELIVDHRVRLTPQVVVATATAINRLAAAVGDHFLMAEKSEPNLADAHKRLMAMIEKLRTDAVAGGLPADYFKEMKAALIARVRANLATG